MSKTPSETSTAALRALLAGLALLSAAATARTRAPAMAVDSIAVTVGDMERALSFYEGVLGFEQVAEQEVAGEAVEHLYGVFGARIRIVRLKLGGEYLDLEQFIAPRGRPVPFDAQSNDRSFQHVAIIVADMDRAYAWLRQHKVEHASTGPQLLPAWNPNAGGIAAFYFRDPDGHTLEVLHFPAGKGDPKWQARTDRLFLGIDHTAIVVTDTDASLSYYRDTLGLAVAGSSENYGTEQEHLNNVFGARLRITALRAGSGPGIELLEYLTPRTGRPMPADTRANDLWSWHVNLKTDVDAADQAIRRRHFTYVSPGAVSITFGKPSTGLMVRDPDGHALLLQGP